MEKIYLSKDWKNMIRWMGAEIGVEDNRSNCLPLNSMGKIVGVRLNAVELRINNHITQWYLFSDSRINFYYPNKGSGTF